MYLEGFILNISVGARTLTSKNGDFSLHYYLHIVYIFLELCYIAFLSWHELTFQAAKCKLAIFIHTLFLSISRSPLFCEYAEIFLKIHEFIV